jgi:hypothetical protein
MTKITKKGKKFALAEFKKRKALKTKQIDNAMLYAGSPMYFYCKYCGVLSDELPESYTIPPKRCCKECKALVDLGWI